MRIGLRYIKALSFFVTIVLVMSACSEQKWGIDQSSIPTCSSDRNDSSAAILLPPETTIKAVEPNTKVRIWHYSNSDKMVCLVSGLAVISGGNK